MAEDGYSLDFHPESKAYLEAIEKSGIMDSSVSAEVRSVEKLRDVLKVSKKIGVIETTKEYEGTKEELLVPFTEVEGGIPVYVYKPKSLGHDSDGVPILVYFHGGGFIVGSRDLADDACKMLSSQAGCIIVNVEYRLAPEHKFPAMLNDAYAAVRWVLDNRDSVGGTPQSKVGVAGDSAGGQIAASVSQQVPGVDFQILIYPLLSGGDRNLPSYEKFKNAPLLNEEFLIWIEGHLVEKKDDLRDPRFCILRNEKFDHLPPTLLIVAEFDPIRDDSYEYSKRLTAAGVQSEVFLSKGALHGYFTAPGAFVQLCREAYAKAVEFINKVRKQH